MKQNKIKTWLYCFSLAVAVIIVYKFLDNFTEIGIFISNLAKVLMPFILGVLIAYILYIPCRKIEKSLKNSKRKLLNKRSRGLSIFITYLIVAMILFILINVILPPITASVKELIGNLPGYYNTINNVINTLPIESEMLEINTEEIIQQVSSIDFASYLSIENILNYIRGVLNVASGVFSLFVTIIISIYTLSERENILKFLKKAIASLLNKEKYEIIAKYFRKTNEIFFNFISGQLIDAVIVGIVTTIAMLIMKVKYATLLGFIIGLFNLIPFFGAIVAVIIAILITICTGGLAKAIWLAIIVIILQQIDANIINPKILGDKLMLSPILIIFSVAFAGAYFGILGMFLAVPTMALIKLITEDYLDYKMKKKEHNN